MANLNIEELEGFEDLFGMSTGYVIDFSNDTFRRFIKRTIGLDVYEGNGYTDYCSKANKLRQIWEKESDNSVGKLMDAMLTHYEGFKRKCNELTPDIVDRIKRLRIVCQRLLGNMGKIVLPDTDEETLQTLLNDIDHSLSINNPTLCLDRLHTFSTKFMRQVCEKNGIAIVDIKGKHLPLQSLAGMLKNMYKETGQFESTFTLLAIQNSISLFDKFYEIRNTQSYAHDNELLNDIEATFAVKIMSTLLCFINAVENQREAMANSKE